MLIKSHKTALIAREAKREDFVVDEEMIAAITATGVGSVAFGFTTVVVMAKNEQPVTPLVEPTAVKDNRAFAERMRLKRGEVIVGVDLPRKGSPALCRQVSGITAGLRVLHNAVSCYSTIDLGPLSTTDRIPGWHNAIPIGEQVVWFAGAFLFAALHVPTYELVQDPEARNTHEVHRALCSLVYSHASTAPQHPIRVETSNADFAHALRLLFTGATEVATVAVPGLTYTSAIYRIASPLIEGSHALVTIDLTSDS